MLSRVLALVLVAPASAAGEPPDVQVVDRFAARWSAALELIPRIREGSIVAASRCGAEFLALHTEIPAGDERYVVALFNAAVCHEAAGMWSQAATEYRRLIDRWPDDARAESSISALARGHLAVGNFAEAAEFAELYAARYPKAKDTVDRLIDAYLVRVGLDQRDRALAVLDRLQMRLLRDNPPVAASMFWRRGDLMRTDAERIEHAEAYLRRHGKSGGPDRAVVAYARIGQLRWEAACEKVQADDRLCITVQRGPSPVSGHESHATRVRLKVRGRARPESRDCTQRSTAIVTVFPRNVRGSAEARRWLSTALSMARRQPIYIAEDDLVRRREFEDAVAMASVYLADADFEELAAVDVPAGLSFAAGGDPKQRRAREDSLRRFTEFVRRTGELSRALERRYAEVAAGPSPTWKIVAATRMGQLAEYRAAALLRAEVPRELREPQVAATYCAAMREQAAPLFEQAAQAYARCVEMSIASGMFTEFTRACETSLHARDPRGWPLADEIFNTAQYTASYPVSVGVRLSAPIDGEPVAESWR